MYQFFVITLAGLLGTWAMTSILSWVSKYTPARLDVIRPLGGLVTHDREQAYLPGLIIHCLNGIIFAWGYYYLLKLSGIPINAFFGGFLGLLHGTLAMLIGSAVTQEPDPLGKTHKSQEALTAIGRILGHGIYGTVVAVIFSILLK